MKNNRPLAKVLFALSVVLAGALLWAALFWHPQPSQQTLTTLDYLPPGTADLRPSDLGGGFTLKSADGPVSLKDFRGKVVLVYFGYTFCPDICPTNLAIIATAFNQLSAAEQAQVRAIFISVDPKRDTPQRLKQYAAYFHPNILGVTGSPDAIARVAKLYGASYRISATANDGEYLVDHSAYTDVVDQEGKLLFALPHAVAPDLLVKTLRNVLNHNY